MRLAAEAVRNHLQCIIIEGINADGLPFPIKNPSKPRALCRQVPSHLLDMDASSSTQAHKKVGGGASWRVWANAIVLGCWREYTRSCEEGPLRLYE